MSSRKPDRIVLGLARAAILLPLLPACYEDSAIDVRAAPIFRAYAAERVYHCPVPFFSERSPGVREFYDGADLVLRSGGYVELTFYSRFHASEDPINWSADTTRVSGTYERDGFIVRFVFDDGYANTVPMEGELVEGGRLLAAFADGGQMEFVPIDQRPTDAPERCEP